MTTLTDQAEYDAFGPWVGRVTEPGEIPRLFRSYPLVPDAATLILKIPREIARRDATPSTDLYDLLVITDAERLTVLTRHGRTFTEQHLQLRDIVIIQDSVNLLDGKLRLFGRAGSEIVIPYNGSSRALIGQLVDIIRAVPPRSNSSRLLPALSGPGRDDLGRSDVSLTGDFQDLVDREPGIEYYGGHGRAAVTPIGRLARLVGRVRPTVLHAAVLGGTPDELQILSRRDWLSRGRTPVLSRSRTIIRVADIDSTEANAHPVYDDVDVLQVTAGAAVIRFEVPPDSAVERGLIIVGRHGR